jgi:hypothetical protein
MSKMSRPEFLNCIMTPEVIRSIRERQESYDKDPQEYERREREAKEQRLRDEQEEYDRFREDDK